jgi:putative chitinase
MYKINTRLRIAHFLAQLLHESNGFRAVREYATGAAYEGRKDLGNTQPGDGVRFRGRGLIQLTGRSNYQAFADRFKLDVISQPELLEQPRWGAVTALYYWNSRSLNKKVDARYLPPEKAEGMSQDEQRLRAITRIVNGGYNGLDDRRKYLNRCYDAFSKEVI